VELADFFVERHLRDNFLGSHLGILLGLRTNHTHAPREGRYNNEDRASSSQRKPKRSATI